jgi:hypothetical protein
MSSSALVPAKEEAFASIDRTFVMPNNLKEALELCNVIAGSSLVPKNYFNRPGDVFVAAKFGQALGLSILQSVLALAVINGRPGIFGDDMLAVVQAHPAYEFHKEFWEGDGEKLVAVHQIKRRGQEMHESRFSVQDAKTAGLWDDRARISSKDGGDMRNPAPWHCYPKRMLMMRARGFGLRDKFADALRGMKSVEELQDYPNTIEGTFETSPNPASAAPTGNAAAGNGTPGGKAGQDSTTTEVLKREAAAFAAEWHNEAKANHNSKEMRSYLKDVLKVESSLDIAVAQRADALAWAKTKPAEQTPAADSKSPSEPPAATPYDPYFVALGWNPEQRKEYIGKMQKFTEAQIKADLNRLVEEQDSKKK